MIFIKNYHSQAKKKCFWKKYNVSHHQIAKLARNRSNDIQWTYHFTKLNWPIRFQSVLCFFSTNHRTPLYSMSLTFCWNSFTSKEIDRNKPDFKVFWHPQRWSDVNFSITVTFRFIETPGKIEEFQWFTAQKTVYDLTFWFMLERGNFRI